MRGFIKRKEGLLCAEKRRKCSQTGKKLQVKRWEKIVTFSVKEESSLKKHCRFCLNRGVPRNRKQQGINTLLKS
jgi:hypothetical protein